VTTEEAFEYTVLAMCDYVTDLSAAARQHLIFGEAVLMSLLFKERFPGPPRGGGSSQEASASAFERARIPFRLPFKVGSPPPPPGGVPRIPLGPAEGWEIFLKRFTFSLFDPPGTPDQGWVGVFQTPPPGLEKEAWAGPGAAGPCPQRPLDEIFKLVGDIFIPRGVDVPALNRTTKWAFTPGRDLPEGVKTPKVGTRPFWDFNQKLFMCAND